ncbi:MAG: HAD family hydrolase [Terracidiphilus sp.]|jgi:beta-phosphoglucomutase
MPQALVFDYDGVLADTEPLHWKSWAALFRPLDVELTWEEYGRIGRGVSDIQMFASLVKNAPRLPVDELMLLNLERRRMVLEWSLAESPIPRETIELLAALEAYRIGLVTSSDRADVEPVLRASGIYDKFDAIVFGNDVAAHKPAPDPYLLIAKKLGVSTGTAFEDSNSGMKSALAAGFNAVRIEHPKDLAQIVAQSLRNQEDQ